MFDSLKESNPTCVYIRLGDVRKGTRRKQDDEDGGIQYFRSVSRYDINNAFLEKHLPLSNHIHGPFKMMPPKLLHTSGSGLIMYMFKLLCYQLGVRKDRDYIYREHIVVFNIIKCQSEHDFPQGSMHNGLIDGTKCQSSEQKGNRFWLLCIAHKTNARFFLQTALQLSDC
jgi:hypothetical protein